MAGLDVKVSQLGEVVVASDNDLLNLVTYDDQNQTYISGKVKASTMKDYMIGDTDISELGDGTPTGAIDALDGKIDDNYDEGKEQWQETGAYNLLKPGHASISDYGALFVENADGTVTKSGTVSGGNAQYVYVVPTNEPYTPVADLIPGRKYKLVGCPSGGGDNVYEIYLQYRNADNTGWAETYHDYGSGVEFTAKNARFGVYIRVFNGNADTLKFKPMITADLNATYDDYQQYAKTNRELTEKVDELYGSTNNKISYIRGYYQYSNTISNILTLIQNFLSDISITNNLGVIDAVIVGNTPWSVRGYCYSSKDFAVLTAMRYDGSCKLFYRSSSTDTIKDFTTT